MVVFMFTMHALATASINHEFRPKVPTLKEGYILKRQRGRSSKADLTKLKFQQRYISLNQDSIQYYVDKTVSIILNYLRI